MYELKTKENNLDVMIYISSLTDEKRKSDSIKLLDIFKALTNEEPKMWGTSIIGFGKIKYKNSTQKEFDWFKVGFSPRKNSLSLYLTAYSDYIYKKAESMNLKHGKGCVYIKDLNMVNLEVLKDMILYSISKEAYNG